MCVRVSYRLSKLVEHNCDGRQWYLELLLFFEIFINNLLEGVKGIKITGKHGGSKNSPKKSFVFSMNERCKESSQVWCDENKK
ncbi:hypothetical protein AYI69_g2728 [Smittium culicis]|uniref:Uncharacterized protein n=1 Tax=Smittium culicis TaxID=133412 RepID=A0A1R1YLN5_9FUNG|nr:hypothetical protein AYI69_g2728 [Smittium culicis]